MRYFYISFFKRPNGQIDEQVGFSKKLRTQELQTCNVILDYKQKKIVKCVIEGKIVPTDFDRMHEYYYKIYPQLIDQLQKNQEE